MDSDIMTHEDYHTMYDIKCSVRHGERNLEKNGKQAVYNNTPLG